MHTKDHPVRDATSADMRPAGHCLARAFETDPVTRFLFPSAARRPRRLPRFYHLVAREIGAEGRVLTVDGIRGAAVWRAPSPPRPARLKRIWSGVCFVSVLGRAVIRGRDFFDALERAHVREPHWYLAALGTDPQAQGTGIGSALMRPVLEQCDREGILAYLESSKEENIPFYRRHGFEVTDEVRVAGAPPIWPMQRRPQAQSG